MSETVNLINALEAYQSIIFAAEKVKTNTNIIAKNKIDLPDPFDIKKDATQFIYDIICELSFISKNSPDKDMYFLYNLFGNDLSNDLLTIEHLNSYTKNCYQEKGYIARKEAPLFLILIKNYDNELKTTFYKKTLDSIQSISDAYINIKNSNVRFEMKQFIGEYFEIVISEVNSFFDNKNQRNNEGQCKNTYTVNSNSTMSEEQKKIFDEVFSNFDTMFGGSSSNNKKDNKEYNFHESQGEPIKNYNDSEKECHERPINKAEKNVDPNDVYSHNKTVRKYSAEEKKANSHIIAVYLWVLPLLAGIILIVNSFFFPALLCFVASLICACVANNKKSTKCPNCGKLSAMKEINRAFLDSNYGTKRETVTDRNPIRDLRGNITGYNFANREVTVDVKNSYYHVINECQYCKYRYEKDIVVTTEC